MPKKIVPEWDLNTLLEVSWTDASGFAHWHSAREALEHTTIPARSIGYLVQRTKDFISITQTQTPGPEGGRANTLSIPSKWISKIRKLS